MNTNPPTHSHDLVYRVISGRTDELGLLARRTLPDGRELTIQGSAGTYRLTIGPPVERGYYDDAWDFNSPSIVVEQFLKWNPALSPEPEGWYRNLQSGRRRPGGDPRKEYVRP